MNFIQGIITAIDESASGGRLVAVDQLTGLSGDKIIGLLQRAAVVADQAATGCYLEVGVFRGLTLTSVAAAVPGLPCFGVDNFSQFDPNGENHLFVKQSISNHTSGNAALINADFEAALISLDEHIGRHKVSVYFVDGPHDYRSQYVSLDLVRKHLAEDCVIIVDDSNYEHVRRANCDWLLANPEFALIYEAYTTCHPNNMTPEMYRNARAGWWNGINVIVRDTDHTLERIYPPVDQSRELYLNDHIVHSARAADLAPVLVTAASRSKTQLLLALLKCLFSNRMTREQFAAMNTRSDKLEPARRATFTD